MAISRNRRSGASPEPRPWIFPSLKVDGEVYPHSISIANTGQSILEAQTQAGKRIRQLRKAEAAESVSIAEETAEASNNPNSGDSQVDVSPVMSPINVEPTIREWLAAHLPSSEQLFSASASLVGLQGIDQRVRDLVASFQESLDNYRATFTEWQTGVSGEWLALVDEAQSLLVAWGAKVEETDKFRADLEADLRKFVSTLRGPQGKVGNTGLAGAAVTVVDRLPKNKGVDFTRPFLGRDAVPGDIAIDATTDMRFGWRWDGQRWEKGPAMVSLQVRDVKIASHQGAPQYISQNIIKAGGGGAGSGGERFLTAGPIGKGATTALADSSNHSVKGINIHSGVLTISVTDTATNRSGICRLAFNKDSLTAAGNKWTEFMLVGQLFEGPTPLNVDIALRKETASVPAGITAPPVATWAQALKVDILLNGGGVGPFLISGAVEWSLPAKGGALGPATAGDTPAWTWA